MLLLLACVESDNKGAPFSVWPTELRFAYPPPADDDGTQSLTLTNDGDAPLELSAPAVSGDAFTLSGFPSRSLVPGESDTLFVRYEPRGLDDTGTLTLASADPSAPALAVPLLVDYATGFEVSPSVIDFGAVDPGTAESATVTLANSGWRTITLDAVEVTGDGFALATRVASVLPPQTSTAAMVTWDTTVPGTYDGALTVRTDVGDTIVSLHGVSVDLPVAVCAADPTVLTLGEAASLSSVGSYSPRGAAIVTEVWTVVRRPSGSSSVPEGEGDDVVQFWPDVRGGYTLELVVTDEDGYESAPCGVELNVASAGLWVELRWTESDDFDLHLLAPGGELTTSTDCFYWNCTGGGLDWGVLGVTEDDPLLDGDVLAGSGSENTFILAPAEGTYTVYVHDFPGHALDESEATVNIWYDRLLMYTDTRAFVGEDSYTAIAEISFPDGTVTER